MRFLLLLTWLAFGTDHMNASRPSTKDFQQTVLIQCQNGQLDSVTCDAVGELALLSPKGRKLDMMDVVLRQLSRKLAQDPKYVKLGSSEEEIRKIIYERLKRFKELLRDFLQP
jgi:hypothetical protein